MVRGVLLGVLSFCCVGCSAMKLHMGGGGSNVVLSAKDLHAVGNVVAAKVAGKYSVLSNKPLTAYVNKVGQVIRAVSDKPETFGGYRFAVLDTDELLTVGTPGGVVFISRGLLQTIPNEDVLAAALAAEVAHIVNDDAVSDLPDALFEPAMKSAGSDEGLATSLQQVAERATTIVMTEGYADGEYYAADSYAEQLLDRADYDSGAVRQLLEVVSAKPPVTHPSFKGAKGRLAKLSPPVGGSTFIADAQKRRAKRYAQALAAAKLKPGS